MAFVLKKVARAGDPISPGRSFVPQAPGATSSPQIPGQVPDRSSVPNHGELPIQLPTAEVRPPMTEFGTAQRIMGVYEPRDGSNTDPTRFEQATVSYEELRKADPALRTPVRPTPGYALVEGTRIANPALSALSAGAETDFVDG